MVKENFKKAYFSGGCFWGMEELFRKQKGVEDTNVGYTGGENENPNYENHPGHSEAIEVIYDPKVISFKRLLDFFFRIHNPSTLNQQGNDIGDSYRSAIFYQSDDEKKQAEKFIEIVNKSKRWSGLVVTTLEKFKKFYLAEDYHQNYLVKNPNGYTCHNIKFDSYL